MAARGFFRARFLLYCFKRNWHISETVFTGTTSVDSLYSRKRVSGVQCSSFKGKTVIDRDGDLERKGWENSYKNGEQTYCQKISHFIVLATFCGLYFVWSTTTVYAGGKRDEEKEDDEFRRHKGCFASKRRIQSVKNLTTANKCRTEVKENLPEEEKDCGPPRKIKTRSQQVCCVWYTVISLNCCKSAGSTITIPFHLLFFKN